MRLSPTQIQSLLFLKYARPGVRTIGGLANRLGVTYATSSGVADALEGKRLIKRAPLSDDQRIITLALTSQGESKTELLEDVLDQIESAVDALPEAEQRGFHVWTKQHECDRFESIINVVLHEQTISSA
ncbi:MAG: hypothetical protein C4294_20225 [Nitrospiraceae bacterium]